MRIITTKSGAVVRTYGDVTQMPIKRYNELQKYLLMESGIGGDIGAVNTRFSKLYSFLSADMKDDALKEAENLHYCISSVLKGVNYHTYAFACIVESIDGVPYDDISETGLHNTVSILTELDLTQAEIVEEVEEVKKK